MQPELTAIGHLLPQHKVNYRYQLFCWHTEVAGIMSRLGCGN